jgi:hypothetical protein
MMSPRSKKEYMEVIHKQYKHASRSEKKVILDEFCTTSGWWTQEAFEKELAERGVVPENMIVFLKKPFQFEQIVVLLEKLRQGGNNNLESQ